MPTTVSNGKSQTAQGKPYEPQSAIERDHIVPRGQADRGFRKAHEVSSAAIEANRQAKRMPKS
jgi:hypothetical protein